MRNLEAGAGFAVVAGEVRNLAMRAAAMNQARLVYSSEIVPALLGDIRR